MVDAVLFPARILRRFVETLSAELGQDTLPIVLEKAGLPSDWVKPAHPGPLNDIGAAQAYSDLQTALRTYYGRGARGILLRIGSKLWNCVLEDAAFVRKAQAVLMRGLPAGLRRKAALDLLARLISAREGDITVHTLDLDLLFVDHASPTAQGRAEEHPICFVTHGLIRECLYWAVKQEPDIEETACRAMGAKECEFKITFGG